jgi:hypothetical protein
MNAFRPLLVVSFCLALLNSSAVAQEYFTATITHDQETGAAGTTPLITSTGDPRPLSYGMATFILNATATALSFNATVYNLDVTGSQTPNDTNDNLGAAHIHAAAAGVAGSVVWGFLGAPDNDIIGVPFVATPFADGVGGTFSGTWDLTEGNSTALIDRSLAAQLGNIRAGNTYINFHTPQFGGGEIRGQILSIPDAGSTAALLGLAVFGLLGVHRKLKGRS